MGKKANQMLVDEFKQINKNANSTLPQPKNISSKQHAELAQEMSAMYAHTDLEYQDFCDERVAKGASGVSDEGHRPFLDKLKDGANKNFSKGSLLRVPGKALMVLPKAVLGLSPWNVSDSVYATFDSIGVGSHSDKERSIQHRQQYEAKQRYQLNKMMGSHDLLLNRQRDQMLAKVGLANDSHEAPNELTKQALINFGFLNDKKHYDEADYNEAKRRLQELAYQTFGLSSVEELRKNIEGNFEERQKNANKAFNAPSTQQQIQEDSNTFVYERLVTQFNDSHMSWKEWFLGGDERGIRASDEPANVEVKNPQDTYTTWSVSVYVTWDNSDSQRVPTSVKHTHYKNSIFYPFRNFREEKALDLELELITIGALKSGKKSFTAYGDWSKSEQKKIWYHLKSHGINVSFEKPKFEPTPKDHDIVRERSRDYAKRYKKSFVDGGRKKGVDNPKDFSPSEVKQQQGNTQQAVLNAKLVYQLLMLAKQAKTPQEINQINNQIDGILSEEWATDKDAFKKFQEELNAQFGAAESTIQYSENAEETKDGRMQPITDYLNRSDDDSNMVSKFEQKIQELNREPKDNLNPDQIVNDLLGSAQLDKDRFASLYNERVVNHNHVSQINDNPDSVNALKPDLANNIRQANDSGKLRALVTEYNELIQNATLNTNVEAKFNNIQNRIPKEGHGLGDDYWINEFKTNLAGMDGLGVNSNDELSDINRKTQQYIQHRHLDRAAEQLVRLVSDMQNPAAVTISDRPSTPEDLTSKKAGIFKLLPSEMAEDDVKYFTEKYNKLLGQEPAESRKYKQTPSLKTEGATTAELERQVGTMLDKLNNGLHLDGLAWKLIDDLSGKDNLVQRKEVVDNFINDNNLENNYGNFAHAFNRIASNNKTASYPAIREQESGDLRNFRQAGRLLTKGTLAQDLQASAKAQFLNGEAKKAYQQVQSKAETDNKSLNFNFLKTSLRAEDINDFVAAYNNRSVTGYFGGKLVLNDNPTVDTLIKGLEDLAIKGRDLNQNAESTANRLISENHDAFLDAAKEPENLEKLFGTDELLSSGPSVKEPKFEQLNKVAEDILSREVPKPLLKGVAQELEKKPTLATNLIYGHTDHEMSHIAKNISEKHMQKDKNLISLFQAYGELRGKAANPIAKEINESLKGGHWPKADDLVATRVSNLNVDSVNQSHPQSNQKALVEGYLKAYDKENKTKLFENYQGKSSEATLFNNFKQTLAEHAQQKIDALAEAKAQEVITAYFKQTGNEVKSFDQVINDTSAKLYNENSEKFKQALRGEFNKDNLGNSALAPVIGAVKNASDKPTDDNSFNVAVKLVDQLAKFKKEFDSVDDKEQIDNKVNEWFTNESAPYKNVGEAFIKAAKQLLGLGDNQNFSEAVKEKLNSNIPDSPSMGK